MTLYKEWSFSKNTNIKFLDEKPQLPWYIHSVINNPAEWLLTVSSDNNIDEILRLNDIKFKSEYNFFEDTILYSFANEYDLNVAKLLI